MHLGGDAYIMRLPSFALAVTVTWWLNRHWTFHATKTQRTRREYTTYLAVQMLGAGINYTVYALVLSALGVSEPHAFWALMAGSAVALLWNFWAMRRFVFTGREGVTGRAWCCRAAISVKFFQVNDQMQPYGQDQNGCRFRPECAQGFYHLKLSPCPVPEPPL